MSASGVGQTATVAVYVVAGLSVEVRCNERVVAELVDGRFRPLRVEGDGTGAADIVIDVRGPGADPGWPASPKGTLRPIYEAPAGSIGYADEADELYVFYDERIVFRCRPASGRIELAIVSGRLADVLFATQLLLTIGIMETFKRFGRFPLHAGALARRGRGILLPGTSGAGKSTTTVALVRAGFDFLADDTVFLSTSTSAPADPWSATGGTDVAVTGFPDQVDVSERTAAMVPELRPLLEQPLLPGRKKHSFRIEDVFGSRIVEQCRPVALVFPRVVPGRRSSTEPLGASEALRALVPDLLLTEPVATQAHLDMLGGLARTVPGFTLLAGSDLDGVAACLSELVQGVAL
jgi:hypothetical protein